MTVMSWYYWVTSLPGSIGYTVFAWVSLPVGILLSLLKNVMVCSYCTYVLIVPNNFLRCYSQNFMDLEVLASVVYGSIISHWLSVELYCIICYHFTSFSCPNEWLSTYICHIMIHNNIRKYPWSNPHNGFNHITHKQLKSYGCSQLPSFSLAEVRRKHSRLPVAGLIIYLFFTGYSLVKTHRCGWNGTAKGVQVNWLTELTVYFEAPLWYYLVRPLSC